MRQFFILAGLAAFLTCNVFSGDILVDEREPKSHELGFQPAEGKILHRTPAPFVWKEQKNASYYELECAQDADFKSDVTREPKLTLNVFCGSKAMPAGTWYWRVRYYDKKQKAFSKWSKVRKFTIAENASLNPMPQIQDLFSRIPKNHPRIFMRPEDLPKYKKLAKNEMKGEYDSLISECNKLLSSPPDTTEPIKYPEGVKRPSKEWMNIWWGNRKKIIKALGSAAKLGFAYQLTGDKKYGELAKKILLECQKWDPKGSTSMKYNDEAGMPYLYYFARTYSFINDLLSEEQKKACRETVRIRGREAYNSMYPKFFYRPYESHKNRLWHFLSEAGLVFYGEIPEAQEWLWAGMNVYYCVYPVWGDKDGGWHEGLWYWWQYQERFLWWADIMKSAFGININDRDFYSQTGYYAMYVHPPNSVGSGFGDLAGICRKQHGHVMQALALICQNPYWLWYSEQLAPLRKNVPYINFARNAQNNIQPKAPIDLPPSRCFYGIGLACMNTNLLDAKKNVQVLFKSSPTGTASHGYDANNSFILNAYGERLLVRSGFRDCYGCNFHKNWMWETKSQNNITVNGKGQIKHSRDALGEILEFSQSKRFDYVVGEAAKSYEGIVKSYKRRILFCKPYAIVIIDTLQSAKPSEFTWHLHAPTKMTIANQHDIKVVNKGAACEIDFLYPQNLKISQTDKFDPPIRKDVKLVQYHLDATTENKSTDQVFITLIRPYKSEDKLKGEVNFKETPKQFTLEVGLPESDLTVYIDRTDFSIAAEYGNDKIESDKTP